PLDRPRPVVPTSQGSLVRLEMPLSLLDSVEAIARAEEATPFVVLLAAFEVLAKRYSGQSDIVIGTPISNRTPPERDNLIGFFLNSLPIRVNVDEGSSFLELLRQVRKVSFDAFAHQDLPFEKLVEEVAPERSLSHSPIFQVVFAYQNAPGGAA